VDRFLRLDLAGKGSGKKTVKFTHIRLLPFVRPQPQYQVRPTRLAVEINAIDPIHCHHRICD